MALKGIFNLRPHQEDAVNKLLDKDGNLFFSHATGSGKTLSSIAGFEALRAAGKANKALIVAPASLRENFGVGGINKFTDDKYVIFGNKNENEGKDQRYVDPDKYTGDDKYHIVSYDMYKKDPAKYINAAKADTVIYDEIHRARNEGTKVTEVIKAARPLHRNFIGLTGSIVSNTPADIVPLIDGMTDGRHGLGSKASFDNRFLRVNKAGRKEVISPNVVRGLTAPYVHHVEVEDLNIASPPKKIIVEKKVPMSTRQEELFRYIIDKLDPVTRAKLNLKIGKLNDREIKAIFSKLMAARQVANYTGVVSPDTPDAVALEESPKMKMVIEDAIKHLEETPDGKVLIGTQFINGGITQLKKHLEERGYNPALFVGKGNPGVTEATRQQAIEDYNSGKKRLLLISGAGGEGLDLPNTTMISMLDGHYNPEIINQMEARGIRAGGLAHRPEKDRKVVVNRYITYPSYSKTDAILNIAEAINPTTYVGRILRGEKLVQNPMQRPFSTDETMYRIAKNKEETNKELKTMYKKASGKFFNTNQVMKDYYNEFSKELESGQEGWFDRPKEQLYIDKFKDLNKNIAKSKKYETIDTKSSFGFKSKDFDEKGKLKFMSNLKSGAKVGLVSGPGVILPTAGTMLLSDAKDHPKQYFGTLIGGSALVGGILGIGHMRDNTKTDYGLNNKAYARRITKLDDEDIRNMLRGQVVKLKEEKVTDLYVK